MQKTPPYLTRLRLPRAASSVFTLIHLEGRRVHKTRIIQGAFGGKVLSPRLQRISRLWTVLCMVLFWMSFASLNRSPNKGHGTRNDIEAIIKERLIFSIQNGRHLGNINNFSKVKNLVAYTSRDSLAEKVLKIIISIQGST